MYLKMAGETLNGNYESLSNDDLRQQLETLKKQIEAMSKVLEERQGAENTQRSGDQTNDGDLNVDNVHLYSWGGKKIEKSGVLDVIKSLKEPYKSEINGFVKNKDILGLQKYLNGKIDSGSIDRIKLETALAGKRIWLNSGHIFEDGKFGPQTLETIKCLQDVSGGNELVEGGDNGNKEKGDKGGEKGGEGGEKSDKGGEKEKNYTIIVGGGRITKEVTIDSVGELPKYKWDNPGNYDESNESTYPTIYRTKDGKYTFYGSGKCISPEGMKNTEDVVKKWKNGSKEYSGELPHGYAKTVKSHIEKLIKSLPNLGGSETVFMEVNGDKLFIKSTRINFGEDKLWGIPEVEIDLKKCLDGNGEFKDEYIKNEIIPNSIKKLREKKKPILACDEIRRGNKKYSKKEIFGGISLNAIDETLVDNYFDYFHSDTLEFNDDGGTDTSFDISGNNANIRLRFDDANGDEDWNRRDKNPDLVFPCSEIMDDNFKLNENKLKLKLRGIILKVIKRTDFKNAT